MLGTEPEPCQNPRCIERDKVLNEFVNNKFLTDRLYRLVQHGLSQCIQAHGPVTRGFLPSASKRVSQNIRNSLRELLKVADEESQCYDVVGGNGTQPE